MRKKTIYTGLLLGVLTLLLLTPDIAMAADSIGDILGGGSKSMTASDFSDKVIDFGKDINEGTSFQTEFQKIFLGMNTVFRSIITILTVAAGAMIAFGIEDGKKTVWQFMLGIGLAYNFGVFLFEVFGNTGILMSVDDIAAAHKGTSAAAEILKNANENGNDDILSEIMAVYSGTIINNGMPVLQAIALRMTIALAALEGGYKIAMDLYSGDKVKFMLTYVFKAGFYCFLIMEWLNIGQALSGFFQSAGFLAAGESGFSTVNPASADADTTFRPDSIWHNATAFLMLALTGKKAGDSDPGFGFWDAAKEAGILSLAGGVLTAATGGVGALLGPVVVILFVLFIVGLMFFISVEMFVARIEFYTMLMLSVVFLPFGVTERLAFLSNSAISLMFNSGAKMMVISFLQVMIAKILSSYLLKLKVNPFDPSNLAVLCQLAIMCVFFTYITKKIPDLVASFLNGSPALSGGGMISQAKSMAQNAGTVVGAAVGAHAVASGQVAAAGGSGFTGKVSALAKTPGIMAKAGLQNAMARNPFTQGYASGMKGVVGGDGSLQNKSFADGVRRLAGLDTSRPSDTQSLASVARDGWRPEPSKPSTPHKEAANGKMPSGVSKRNSASFSKSPGGMKGKVDTSGKLSGLAATAGGSNNNTERSNPVSWQAFAGKDKEKTIEKDFRSESKHTASKEQTTVPGQDTAQKAGSAQAEKIAPAQQPVQAPAVQAKDSPSIQKAEGITDKKMSDQQAGVQMPQANPQVQTAQVSQNSPQPTSPAGGGVSASNAAPQSIAGKAEASGTIPQGNSQIQTVQGKDGTGTASVYTPVNGGTTNSDSSGKKSGSSISDMGNFKKK